MTRKKRENSFKAKGKKNEGNLCVKDSDIKENTLKSTRSPEPRKKKEVKDKIIK